MAIEADRLSIVQGEDVTITVEVIDANGVAVDISTGFAFKASVRIEREGKTEIITKATGGSGITIPVGTDGKYVITFLSADTKKLRVAKGSVPTIYYWDTWRTDSGQQAQEAFGELEVLGSAVQPT